MSDHTNTQLSEDEPTNAYGELFFPEILLMVACPQCTKASPWPLQCGHTHIGIHQQTYIRTRASVAAPQWKPIATAPRNGAAIIVGREKLVPQSVRWMVSVDKGAPDGAWFVGGYNGTRLSWEPTHWTDLPLFIPSPVSPSLTVACPSCGSRTVQHSKGCTDSPTMPEEDPHPAGYDCGGTCAIHRPAFLATTPSDEQENHK